MTRHALNLFSGQPGARRWRRHLSENVHAPDAGLEVVREALARMQSVAVALVAMMLLGTGCSAGVFPYDDCTSNEQCRDAFGYGSVCTEGLCETVTLDPRCTLPDGVTLPADPGAQVVLGSLFDRSTASHLAREQSAALALSQANSENGLGGRTFTLAACTNETDGDAATVELARHLADEIGVPAIVGPSSSARTSSAFVEVEPFGTLLISPSATSPGLTALDGAEHSDDDPGLLWRTAGPDTIQGPAIAQAMIDRGTTRVAAVHRSDTYGDGLAEVVAEAFVGGGRTLALLPFDSEAGLIDQTVNAVSSGDTEEVLFISSDLAEVVAFLNAAATLPAFATVDIVLTDSARNQDLLDDAEDAIDSLGTIRGTSPALPTGPVYDSFRAAYSVAYDEDVTERSFTAHAFDAAWLAAYGAAWADAQEDGLSGLGMARGLRQVSDGATVEIRASGWDGVLAAFATDGSVDAQGASGELDYDPITGETSGPIELWVIAEDGDSFVVTDRVR